MITKLALLSRILPGLFGRLPAVASVGYLMPHKTYLFAGIAGSAVLHATVLFAFNTPHLPPPLDRLPPDVGAMPKGWIEVVVEEEPPPPPDVGPKSNEEEPKPSDAGEETARIPELPSSPFNSVGAVTIDVRIDGGKIPDVGSGRWKVPERASTGGVNAKNIKIFNKDDLDKAPEAASRVNPRYPFELKRQGLAGAVVLRFVVDSRGDVSDVEVVSANYPEFGKSAAEALLKWKFKAGMKDGNRVNTRMELPMNFAVERGT